jgi:glyoxalase-like protein
VVRLRQVVLVAERLEPVADQLRAELGLGEPFADPNVAEFGIHNAVFALGDTFIEVISPNQEGTAAGRHLERLGGDGGYMLIFQLDNLDAARERAAAEGIRVIWQLDLPDISGTHLHPADIGGAIVSLDRADPPGSWRWGGPDWTGRTGTGAPGRVTGATLAVADPDATAARWGRVLGAEPEGGSLTYDGERIDFRSGGEGLAEIAIAVPEPVRRGRDAVEVGGVRFELADAA